MRTGFKLSVILLSFLKTRSMTYSVLIAAVFLAGGCAIRSDPLQGWALCPFPSDCAFDKAIIDDYRNYIRQLPEKDRFHVRDSNISFFKDSTGRRAVKIEIPREGLVLGTWWSHILVYDSDNKRMKTIKYKSGRSLS